MRQGYQRYHGLYVVYQTSVQEVETHHALTVCSLADIPSVLDTMYLASSVSLLPSARLLRSAESARLPTSLGLTVFVLDSASFGNSSMQHRVIDDDGNVIAEDINFRVKKAGKE
jgi:hypothetical protein